MRLTRRSPWEETMLLTLLKNLGNYSTLLVDRNIGAIRILQDKIKYEKIKTINVSLWEKINQTHFIFISITFISIYRLGFIENKNKLRIT